MYKTLFANPITYCVYRHGHNGLANTESFFIHLFICIATVNLNRGSLQLSYDYHCKNTILLLQNWSHLCIRSVLHVTTHSVMCACHCYIGNNCPSLSNPDHGGVYHLSDGTTAIFTCKSGFIKNGESVLHCINGKWSSSPPTCIQP